MKNKKLLALSVVVMLSLASILVLAACTTTHTVMFDLNNGIAEFEVTRQVRDGETIQRPDPEPTRDGYNFRRWVVSGTNTEFNFNTPINADTTIRAVWAALPETDTVVNVAALAGITAPVAGAIPTRTITANNQFTGTVAWSPAAADYFQYGTTYTATITLTARFGYTMQGVDANFFTVTGAAATNPANTGVITAVFPVTGNPPPASIVDISEILGINAPTALGLPAFNITETPQFAGTVTWYPYLSSTAAFALGVEYTATVVLTAKAGYTLAGVSINFFTVAGGTASNGINSGIITVEFPAAPTAAITEFNVEGITPPRTAGTPVETVTGQQFTGTVDWQSQNPNDGFAEDGTFLFTVIYIATITLTPRIDFNFDGVLANMFRVAGAQASHHSAGSGVITATFAPALEQTVSDNDGSGVRQALNFGGRPRAGELPQTVINHPSPTFTASVTSWVSRDGDGFADDGSFLFNAVYIATVTIIPTQGFTLDGVPVNYWTVFGAAGLARSAANSGIVTVEFYFPGTPANVGALSMIINNFNISVTAPAAGAIPVSVINDHPQFTGAVTWVSRPTSAGFGDGGVFLPNVDYTANIALTARNGFIFRGPVVSADFNIANAGVLLNTSPPLQNTGHTAATIFIEARYFASLPVTTITNFDINGIAPVAGQILAAAFDAEQFTGAIVWSNVVTAGTPNTAVYTATITLSPKTGFGFLGVAANSFIVQGATNAVNYTNVAWNRVVAVFPAINVQSMPSSVIAGLPIPQAGAVPTRSIQTEYFTGAVTWSPVIHDNRDPACWMCGWQGPGGPPCGFCVNTSSGAFAANITYTATITLTSRRAGYHFDGVAQNFFTAEGATTTNPANSGVVTAVFAYGFTLTDGTIAAQSSMRRTGEIVTFTIQPPGGKTFDSLTITGIAQSAVIRSTGNLNQFTFTMPANAVTITVVYIYD